MPHVPELLDSCPIVCMCLTLTYATTPRVTMMIFTLVHEDHE